MKSRAANKAKPERPSDIYFLYPPEDITKPAFAQNAQALEQNGGLTQYLNLSECEAASRIAGSKSQMSVLIRNAFDVERGGGQLRCSESGISANPIIRLCMTMSSTPEVAQAFYKRDMRNGFFSRVNIVYVPRGERIGKIPLPECSPILGSEKTRCYRNKLEFGFADKIWLTEEEIRSGKKFEQPGAVGFHTSGAFDKILPIRDCQLMEDINNRLRNGAQAYAYEHIKGAGPRDVEVDARRVPRGVEPALGE